MSEPSIEMNAASVVLTGSFNPRIFQPEWFARQDLLSRSESEHAKIEIIHQQVCQFETERFTVLVTPDRFQLTNQSNSVSEPVRDLLVGTFYILEHTPVQTMGINRHMHFLLHNEDAWHRLGDRLAPKDIWNELNPVRPGLRSLNILYSSATPALPAITVQVEPSTLVMYGAYFSVNYHYNATDKDDSLRNLMQTVEKEWEGIQSNAERIAQRILAWAAQ